MDETVERMVPRNLPDGPGVQARMPQYQSHKRVRALKVKSVTPHDDGGFRVEFEDVGFGTWMFPDTLFARGVAAPGDYLVQYEDGYWSWSPAKPFEDGYTAVSGAEHTGLPVAGYKPQSDERVALVNENKILEERCLRQIDAISCSNYAKEQPLAPPYDARMIALARTGIQEAFMWLNRAVFQPGRVSLPEDAP